MMRRRACTRSAYPGCAAGISVASEPVAAGHLVLRRCQGAATGSAPGCLARIGSTVTTALVLIVPAVLAGSGAIAAGVSAA